MVHRIVELAYTHFMVLTLKPRQNGRYFFADHILVSFSWKNRFLFCLKIHRKLVLMVPVNNKPWLFQIMSWCRTVDKSLSETMKAWSTHWGWVTHICVSKKNPIMTSDNGLSPVRLQTVIWTNATILSIRLRGMFCSEILFQIQSFRSRRFAWKCHSNDMCPAINGQLAWKDSCFK